jgi:hypothetical protein
MFKIIGIGGDRIYGERMIFGGVGWLKGRETLPLRFQLFLLSMFTKSMDFDDGDCFGLLTNVLGY